MKIGRFDLDSIVLGNSYELIKQIPDKSIDLIVTDPPYKLNTEGSKDNNISKSFANCNEQLKDISNGINIEILDEFLRIMKKPNIYIWCNKAQIPEYLDFFYRKHKCNFEVMVWLKTNPTPLCGGNYLIDKEFCLYFRKGVKLNTTFETASTYWITPKNKLDKDKFNHPTIKPLNIIEKLIRNSSNDGDVIFDPFIGSGTTAVATKNVGGGRHYLGFEIDPKWHKIANSRLTNVDATGQMSFITF